MTIEKMLVEHCSATLASIKSANLFSMFFATEEELKHQMIFWNTCMEAKGIRLFVLGIQRERALIYVYRKNQLEQDLQRSGVAEFLKEYGYKSVDVEYALERLKNRILESGNFPHEIGVFLNYPLEDVKGFIENKGKNYQYLGQWKVYCNAEEAKKTFRKYEKCKDVYVRLWGQGRSVMKLTVAA